MSFPPVLYTQIEGITFIRKTFQINLVYIKIWSDIFRFSIIPLIADYSNKN